MADAQGLRMAKMDGKYVGCWDDPELGQMAKENGWKTRCVKNLGLDFAGLFKIDELNDCRSPT